MVVTCAFYGFINRTTKVTLQIDGEQLNVGQSFTFEGDNYVILSVFQADGHYHANVGLEHLHRLRTPARLKAPAPSPAAFEHKDAPDYRKPGPEAALQARLQAAEAKLQDVLRERDEALKLLDHVIQQLDRLQETAEH
jgi:hypothetical protein